MTFVQKTRAFNVDEIQKQINFAIKIYYCTVLSHTLYDYESQIDGHEDRDERYDLNFTSPPPSFLD